MVWGPWSASLQGLSSFLLSPCSTILHFFFSESKKKIFFLIGPFKKSLLKTLLEYCFCFKRRFFWPWVMWDFPVAQRLKRLPAMWETWVWSLGWEDPLEKERLPTLIFWPGGFHGLYSPWGCKESGTTERLSLDNTTNKRYSMNVLKLGIFFSNHRILVLNQKYLVFLVVWFSMENKRHQRKSDLIMFSFSQKCKITLLRGVGIFSDI